MVTSDFRPEVEIRPFRACEMKNAQYNPYLSPNSRNFSILQEIGVDQHEVTSDFRPEVEIWPFRACAMHPTIIIALWTWLWISRCKRISSSVKRLSCVRVLCTNGIHMNPSILKAAKSCAADFSGDAKMHKAWHVFYGRQIDRYIHLYSAYKSTLPCKQWYDLKAKILFYNVITLFL